MMWAFQTFLVLHLVGFLGIRQDVRAVVLDHEIGFHMCDDVVSGIRQIFCLALNTDKEESLCFDSLIDGTSLSFRYHLKVRPGILYNQCKPTFSAVLAVYFALAAVVIIIS